MQKCFASPLCILAPLIEDARLMHVHVGYVPQSRIKIDFSSDLEQGKKKKKKV